MAPETRLKQDFVAFVAMVWAHLGLPRPTPVQKDICLYLQSPKKRKIIQAFRGVGKSWLTSAYVLWRLYRDPQLKVLVVSASKDRSDAFSIFTKRLLSEVAFLQHLAPDPSRGDRDSNVAFDVRPAGAAHAPSVKSVGITGQITGSRADLIVVDDAEVANNSESQLQREKLYTRLAELGGAVLSPREDAAVVYLGTPQCEETVYAKLTASGYETRVWPAEFPADPDVYAGNLAPMVAGLEASPGSPTDPQRFDRVELAERRTEYGRAGYALQFMLDTSISDENRTPLKLRDLIVFDTDVDTAPDRLTWGSAPDQVIEALPMVGLPGDRWHRPAFVAEKWSPYSGAMMYIDPAGRGKDETGYAVLKELHGQLYLRRWGGLGGGYDEPTLAKLATIAKDEKVTKVIVESNFGDGMWLELFRPVLRRIYVTSSGAGCALEEETVRGQKELRALSDLEPVLSGHRLIVDTQVVRDDTRDKGGLSDAEAVFRAGFYQLTRLTKERGCLRFDDRIDALAGAVRYYAARMSRDVAEAAKGAQDDRLEAELEKIREHWFGKESTGLSKTWAGPIITR